MAALTNRPDFRVIISGGGIAGLTLANALQLAGIDYVLLEARTVIAPQVGASIGLLANGSRILDQLGCYEEILELTELVHTEAGHYANGDYISQSDGPLFAGKRTGYDVIFLDRQLVLEVLYRHILDKGKILLNKRLSHVNHTATGITVHCSDGSTYDGDVLAGADGVFSKTRQEMWRAADAADPGKISQKDKNCMFAEYQCLYGISTATNGLDEGRYDVTYMKDFSTMLVTGKDAKVFWFLYERMNQVYHVGNIPKYTKVDAEEFAARHLGAAIMPKGRVTFGDIWENRRSYSLTTLEEAEYEHWTWGRFACLGDSIHKMTPNAGVGGNASIESAAALANAIKKMLDQVTTRPSLEDVNECLTTYQRSREQRMSAIMKMANSLTRIHAMKGLSDRFTAHYVIPNAGDHLVDSQCHVTIGATMLEYLAPPPRSLRAPMPFNPEQGVGREESKLLRALLALPFAGLAVLAFICIDPSPALPTVGEMLQSGRIAWAGGLVSIRISFYHIGFLDETWRPITVFFSPSTFGFDPVSWWQMLTFLTDFGLLYAIYLIESARRANALTFAQIPVLWGLAAQLRGIGCIAPIYYFLHYISTPVEKFAALDMRLTNYAYTRTVLPTMILLYYIPQFLSYLHPSFASRHDWNWFWQMFPVWVSLMQRLLVHTVVPDTVQHDRVHSPKRDLVTIRFTIRTFSVLSAVVWSYTISQAPYLLFTVFIPDTQEENGWLMVVRNLLKYDHLLCFGSSYLWLAYLFQDLKTAGMVKVSWVRMILMAAMTTIALGPGATVGLGWLWREDILANKRHKGAIVKGWKDGETGMKGTNGKVANGHADGHADNGNDIAEKIDVGK